MKDSCTITEAVDGGVWKWPNEWYTYLVLNNIQVPMLNEMEKDIIQWIDKDGKKTVFSTRQVWKDLKVIGQKVNWYDMVWFNQCIPKHAFVLWMAVQGKLMTRDRILKWKPNDRLECALCGNCSDSHDHLFFQCMYSAEIGGNFRKWSNGNQAWIGLILSLILLNLGVIIAFGAFSED